MKKSVSKGLDKHESLALSHQPKLYYKNGNRQLLSDVVIIEQPLQIRLYWLNNTVVQQQIFSITMRTPGDDAVLILGLLLSEGIINSNEQIDSITGEAEDNTGNLWEVKLRAGHIPNISSLERYQVTYSSCGLCGTTSLKSLELKNPPILNDIKHWLLPSDICQMPTLMKAQQNIFQQSGGCHAAALFGQQGEFLSLYEDIGRHNAVDKLLGAKLQSDFEHSLPFCLVVSGRVSFEIVQKAVMSGICVLIAVGAPSDLAIIAAKRFDLTLIGFASKNTFNLYHGEWRISPTER